MKRILVTGASSAIGKALVRMLLQDDWDIWAHYWQHPLPKGWNIHPVRADLATGDGVLLLANSMRKPTPLRALVLLHGGPKRSIGDDLDLNLISPVKLGLAFVENCPGGCLILMSGIAAKYGANLETLGYGLARAGVECLTKTLAKLGAKDGTRVNCVRPGFIDTPLHKRLGRDEAYLAMRERKVPLGRAGKPDEVAEAIMFLLTATYVTGEILTVAGGE